MDEPRNPRANNGGRNGNQKIYTPQLADEICMRIAAGESLRDICDSEDRFPKHYNVLRWVYEDKDGFRERYQLAQKIRSELWVEDLVDIADNATNDWMERHNRDGSTTMLFNKEHVARSDLRIKTRLWIIERTLKAYAKRAAEDEANAGNVVFVENSPDAAKA